ncbi:SubName: Full=Related to tetratricopeptide repeat domain protein-Neosartorya fischeri {ECO:0000313/EMBL:CCA73065.1} [Serendipita indica DSM 11827]|nr:SubName: Full=Related to tetratricopeptide repeat domain protein-Neosartorya fischeri {ECO:0000313/EMBL:CCA73065.1} [Serendipita indica DSM 11827]
MLGLWSRLKSTLGLFQSSSGYIDTSTSPTNPERNKQSGQKPYSKIDDLGFLEIVSGTDPVVDIVAIHGINGHREKTWMTDQGVLWLRDLLPSDLPNARVLTYGYDAETHSQEFVSTQTIHRHAESFVKALSRERQRVPRRPIIFTAHNLGGIILKLALVLCNNQRLEATNGLRDILVSTHGVLFFGTPHSGVEITPLIDINRWVSGHMETTEVILKDIASHSPELENIQRLYVAAGEKINTIFFYEEYTTLDLWNQGGLNVPYHSAMIAGDREATTIVLHANHDDLVKFPDKESDNYRTVLYHLKDHVDSALDAIREKWGREDDSRRAAKGNFTQRGVVQQKPLPPASTSYIERIKIQSLITLRLLPKDRKQRQPRCILHGLGGAGKTQLATNWIRQNEGRFSRVIVVDASNQAQLEADMEWSIRSLGPEYSKMSWKDAVAHLDRNEKGWLLFLDNADSPDLNLAPYLPSSLDGAIIITTRNQECVGYAPDGAVPVGDLEESEAVNLLHTLAHVAPIPSTKSLEIVKELGMLALTITQAGTYIRKTRRLDTYLDTFRDHRARLLRKNPESGTEYTSSTYAAFDLSFHQLPARTQEFMKLLAFLHHSLIPVALFERSIASSFTAYTVLDEISPPGSDKRFISGLRKILGWTWDEITFQEIVGPASRASFIDVSADGLFYNIHPLLQMYIKDRLDKAQNRYFERMATQLILGAIWPSEGGNALNWQIHAHANKVPRSVQTEYLTHALAFRSFYDSLGDWKACHDLLESARSQLQSAQRRSPGSLPWLLREMAWNLRSMGHLEEAEGVGRSALELTRKIFRRSDPATTWAMSNLGSILRDRGQMEEAERLLRESYALTLENFGRQHPDTISAMHSLALTLYDRGQLDEAEKMQKDVLALRLEILGERHLDTIWAMNNFALTLYDRGQLNEAEKMQRDILALRLEIMGQQHPDTMLAKSNLARTLSKRGHLDEAEKMQRDILSLSFKILGQRHPDVILEMHNLALTLSDRGQSDESERLQRDVLALQLEILGERHLDTIWAMNNLALTLYDRGQLDEAEKLQRKVMTLRLDILGPRHTHTISAMRNLAGILHDHGQLEEAEKIKRKILALTLEIVGGQHIDTIKAMESLARTLHNRGQLDEAERIWRETLGLRLEILGKMHIDTIATMDSLALTIYSYGQWDEAEKIWKEVLALRLEILGGQHRATIRVMSRIASTLHKRGQLDEAGKIWREILALRLESLGPRHIDTIDTMDSLALTLYGLGRWDEAEKMWREVLTLRLEILGQTHSDTVRAMKNLAVMLYNSRQWVEAEKMWREVFLLQLEIQGQQHPETLNASYDLALALYACGQFEEAAKLLQETVELRVQVFGEDHTHTLMAKKLLKYVIASSKPPWLFSLLFW